MRRIPLDTGWTLSATAGPVPETIADRTVPAVVPGCVHTDLLREGLIPHPFDGANEAELAWIGRTDWAYETRFDLDDLDAGARAEIVADGLDTFATVILNGAVVGSSANQFRTFRFDVADRLRRGSNHLRIEFAAPVNRAEAEERRHGALPHVAVHPYNTVRKSASNFGWDWGIDVATSGIWKRIGLEVWSGVRLDAVRPLVDVDATTGLLDVHVDLAWAGAEHATVEVAVGDAATGARWERAVEVAAGEAASVRVAVPDARLWWPRGHGAQPLYDVEVRLAGTDQRWNGRVGFRTVALDTVPDADGTPFRLVVNGEPVFVRGANWIPDHAFVTEIDAARYRRRIDDAVEANMNLLRVWGGGIYESDDFYDACDELGVLVWQDFLFACAAYAEEDWLRVEVDAEAREAVTRLSPHPSLVLWNGNNENIVGYAEWGWRPALVGRTWGNHYYRELLPGIVAELDGTRPYSAGSPYSFDDYIGPNEAAHGTMHIWDVWNTRDYTAYAEHRPRFVAEFGFQGPPAWSTLVDVVHDEPLDPYGAQLLVHQKAHEGNRKLERGMTGHLSAPETFDDWHWATQLNQAQAVRFGIEHFRSLGPRMTGTIVWQLNDNWPVVSWAAVDFAERRKPLWFALRDVYRPRLVTVTGGRDADAPVFTLANDEADGWAGTVGIRRIRFDGTELAHAEVVQDVAARSSTSAPIPSAVTDGWDRTREVVVVDAPGFGRAVHSGAEVVDQLLDPDPLEATVEAHADGHVLHVVARSLVRDLTVLADRVHPTASADAGMLTLLAGETARILVRGSVADASALTSPLVLRHANQLAAHARHAVGAAT
jgi:beta-mannosidase